MAVPDPPSVSARPRARRGNDRRAETIDPHKALVCATERLLQTRRLDELTVVDLIREAQVSRATFYLYFESKHDVVASLGEAVTRELYDEVWQPWFSGAEPANFDLLLDHMRSSVAIWRKHAAVLVATAEGWRARAAAYEPWAAMMQGYIEATVDYIERAREAGAAHPDVDPATLARVLVWGNESALYLKLSGQAPDLGDEHLASTLAKVWWRAIFPEPHPGA